jgi:hypothetical protein
MGDMRGVPLPPRPAAVPAVAARVLPPTALLLPLPLAAVVERRGPGNDALASPPGPAPTDDAAGECGAAAGCVNDSTLCGTAATVDLLRCVGVAVGSRWLPEGSRSQKERDTVPEGVLGRAPAAGAMPLRCGRFDGDDGADAPRRYADAAADTTSAVLPNDTLAPCAVLLPLGTGLGENDAVTDSASLGRKVTGSVSTRFLYHVDASR